MSKIHQITHQSDLVAKKVNFFADYFEFLADVIGKDNHLDIENHLSLIEKIIWQVETNFNKCVPYVSNYLNHPYLDPDDAFLKMFNRHKVLFIYFKTFKAVPVKGRKKWLSANPDFLKRLISFKNSLRKGMAAKALYEIISFLRCVHDIPAHKTEILYCSKIIVSEFLLNGHSRRDINKVFEKIMSRDVFDFPFPKTVVSDEEKIKFLSTRNFEQQFEGIFNLLKSKPQSMYFLYRVSGIEVLSDFVFEYNGVSFYSPKHRYLKGISDNHIALRDGETREQALDGVVIALVKLKYFSIDNAEGVAKKKISDGLVFFNSVLKASGNLDKGSYLGSPDLKTFHGMWRFKDEKVEIDGHDMVTLRNNPYYFLKKASGQATRHFLKHEHLFVAAMQSKSVEDFWQYLEALIPDNHRGENWIREVVSAMSLLDAERLSAEKIGNKIAWYIQPFSARSRVFNLSDEQQMRYYNEMQRKKTINFKRLRKELSHPFIEHLLDEKTSWTKVQLLDVKRFYERMLLEAYSQRNAIIHTGEGYHKSLVSLTETFPWLVNKFRQVLFRSIRSDPNLTFNEILHKEMVNSGKLLV